MNLEEFAIKYGLPYDSTGNIDMTKTIQCAADFAANGLRVALLEDALDHIDNITNSDDKCGVHEVVAAMIGPRDAERSKKFEFNRFLDSRWGIETGMTGSILNWIKKP